MHDNTWLGVWVGGNSVAHPNSYRSNSSRSGSVWLPADGTSPWDINSDANGNPVPLGQPGHTFLSGTATGGHTEQVKRDNGGSHR